MKRSKNKAFILITILTLSFISGSIFSQDTKNSWKNNVGIGIKTPTKKLDVLGSARISDNNFQFNTNTSLNIYPYLQVRGMNYKFYDAPLYGFIGYSGIHYVTDNWDDSTRMSVIIIDTSKTYNVQGIDAPDRYWGLRVKRFSKKSAFVNLTVMESQTRGIDYGLQIRNGLANLYIDKTKFMGRFAMDTSDYCPYYQVSLDSGNTWETKFSCNNIGEAYFSSKLGIGVPDPHEKLEVKGSVMVYEEIKLNTQINTINGSSSGTIHWSSPFDGKSYKKIILYFENYSDKGKSIYFPTEFIFAPYLYGNVPLSNFSSNNTALTIQPVSNLNGYLFIEGY